MHKLLQQRRLYSLIVSMAILLNLYAPAIGQAVTVLASDPLALEICGAQSYASGKRAPDGLPSHNVKHCALCALHGGAGAPPPAGNGLLAVLDGRDAWPSPRHAAPPSSPIRHDAQPRAPPASA